MSYGKHLVLGEAGTGSVLAEAFLTLAHISYEFEEVSYSEAGPKLDRLDNINPLRAVPAMILPDKKVLTETVAIMIYANDKNADCHLIPPIGDPRRVLFWRWIMFLATSVYPTFTYSDDVSKWVKSEDGQKQLRSSVTDRQKKLWLILESEIERKTVPRALGLDIFISVMTRWRPRRDWVKDNCPALFERAIEMDSHAELVPIWKKNF